MGTDLHPPARSSGPARPGSLLLLWFLVGLVALGGETPMTVSAAHVTSGAASAATPEEGTAVGARPLLREVRHVVRRRRSRRERRPTGRSLSLARRIHHERWAPRSGAPWRGPPALTH